MLEGIEILDAVGIDGFDSYHLSVDQPLASAGYLPCGGESITRFSEAAVGDPVALRQKATPGGDFLKPMQTSATELQVVQRRAENLKQDEVRNVREVREGGEQDLPDQELR